MSWGTAAAQRGGPSGTPPFEQPSATRLLLRGDDAERRRLDMVRRTHVRLPPGKALPSPPLAGNGEPLECLFLAREPQGTSAKFDCLVDDGSVVKVKYGRNSELHAEVAATSLLHRLSFPADHVALWPRLRCHGCPRFPFFTMQLLSLAGARHWLSPHGYAAGYTDFEWVAVEPRFDATAVETDVTEGWAWFELDDAATASRDDLDALRLLAVFLAHWDNKSSNQRLVCLDETTGPMPRSTCDMPLAMIQDLGSTFGPTKVNLATWRQRPVWTDPRTCAVSMADLPFAGGTFAPRHISEGGRRQLAEALSDITRAEARQLFADARFHVFQSGTDDDRDLDAWADAFLHRVDQVRRAGPCPEIPDAPVAAP